MYTAVLYLLSCFSSVISLSVNSKCQSWLGYCVEEVRRSESVGDGGAGGWIIMCKLSKMEQNVLQWCF